MSVSENNSSRTLRQKRRSRDRAKGGVEVSVRWQAKGEPSGLGRWLKANFRKAVGLATDREAVLCVVVTEDGEMKQLHRAYLNKASTTDVLTFDLSDDDKTDRVPRDGARAGGRSADRRDGVLEGDIVVNLDEARRQAEQRGHETRLELLLYAIHGLMHLLGEDDHDPAAAAAMHRREDRLLEELGFAAVYRVAPVVKRGSRKTIGRAPGRRG